MIFLYVELVGLICFLLRFWLSVGIDQLVFVRGFRDKEFSGHHTSHGTKCYDRKTGTMLHHSRHCFAFFFIQLMDETLLDRFY